MEQNYSSQNISSSAGLEIPTIMEVNFFRVIPRRLNFIYQRFVTLCLWRWNRQSVSKRRHIKFRRRGIIHKKAYNIQNKAKVLNHKFSLPRKNIQPFIPNLRHINLVHTLLVYSLRLILISFLHQHLSLLSCFFPSRFPTKIFNASLCFTLYAISPSIASSLIWWP